jgi:hypothetical protein
VFVSHNILKEKAIFFPIFFKEIESSLHVYMETVESGIAGGGVESRAILSQMSRKQGAIVATVGNCRKKKWQRCAKCTTTDSFNCCECAYYREESNSVVVFEKRMFLV